MIAALRAGSALALSLAMASCGTNRPAGTITVSAIGDDLSAPAFGSRALGPPRAALIAATSRGLVRLDADGQVTPDVAVRWAIIDGGLDYILRIDDGIAPQLALRPLRAATAARRHGPLKRWLSPITGIAPVTSTVAELRLASPMPDLLPLLARPELALTGLPGPMAVRRRSLGTALLIPRAIEAEAARPAGVLLRADRAGRAVARFAAGGADLVIGGSFADLPVARAANPRAATLRQDPATGLFGFVPRNAGGSFADPAVGQALDLAIDRDRIVALIGMDGTRKATTLTGSEIEPPLAERIAAARARLAGRAPFAVRVAMPAGPGAGLLFRLIAQDWARIGVTATRVMADAPADLALIDIVAPAGELARIACAESAGCDERDAIALVAPPFIPLMAPVRWSLVGDRIAGFGENPLAFHPLEYLRIHR